MIVNMVFNFALIIFFIINIIISLGVYGRTISQQPLLAHMATVNSTTSIKGMFDGVQGGRPVVAEDPPEHGTPRVPRPHCVAVVRTNTQKKFYGSNAHLSLNKPGVQASQWSASRIKLSNGPDSIEAGWMVYPSFFNDSEAHFYAKHKAGPDQCLNTYCPGFVQVAKDKPLGSVPAKYSIIGGQQYMWNIAIQKHKDDGNWWLSITFSTIGTFQLGYWPKTLFTALADAANQVEWGGEIDNPGAAQPPPSMGNGFKAAYDQKYSAFFEQITVVDESFNNVIPDGTEKYYDCQNLYTTLDMGNQGGGHGRVIFYGGYED